MRPDIPNNWGNAYQWLGNARSIGWPTGSTPQVGAVGTQGNHVVYIEAVNSDGTVLLWEMNFAYIPFQTRERVAPASDFMYIY